MLRASRPTRIERISCLLSLVVCLQAFLARPAFGQAEQIFDFPAGPVRDSRLTAEQLRTWVNAATSHWAGRVDAEARTIADWPRSRIKEAVAAVEDHARSKGLSQPIGVLGVSADPAIVVLARAVILHTDIAVAASYERSDTAANLRVSSVHLGAAMDVVEFLRRQSPGDGLPLKWYRAAVAWVESRREVSASPAFGDRAVSLFPTDTDLLLMAGCAHELTASPRVQDGVDVAIDVRHRYGNAARNLQKAAEYYRDALKKDPDLVEARVRLGHVLGQLGRHEEALDESSMALARLPQTPDATRRAELEFLACLFLGDAHAALRDGEAARESYERARRIFPRARSVNLALSRLARADGDRDGALAAVRRAFAERVGSPESHAQRGDPWAGYYTAGLARHPDAVLDELRLHVTAMPPPNDDARLGGRACSRGCGSLEEPGAGLR